MCGILGHIARTESGRIAEDAFRSMLATLDRRGPDESTVFRRDALLLGHRRLSIIDVAGGTQPIFNETGTVACILNGEIYNFQELRARLERSGHVFKTHSDTEAIVHLYEELGEAAFAELTGMFAVIIADFERGRTLIARDRMGEKPLYYVDDPRFFACASEIKALRRHPLLQAQVDRRALASYLQFGWIAGNQSILAGVRRLEPAHYLVLEGGSVRKECYWHPDLTPLHASREELCEMLRQELDRSIANKLIADVPLGVFLSGGLDSSTVVAMAARHCSGRLKTYSVGFGSQIDELPFARMVAERYGAEHTELQVEANIADAVAQVATYYDEPFADSSSVPTYLISKAARQHVTVILTGDGGDELLAGYEGYARLRSHSSNRVLSKGLRVADGIAMRCGMGSLLDRCYPLPGAAQARRSWIEMRSTFSNEAVAALLPDAGDYGDPAPASSLPLPAMDPISQAFEFDLNYYLPDDLLKKVDMASMASSLECRAPLLDHRFVELCMRIPAIEKVRGGRDKGLLREAMRPYLPEAILTREKQGFGAPLTQWLSGPLREMVGDLLGSGSKLDALVDPRAVRARADAALGNLRQDWRAPLQLWSLLMLELWVREHHASDSKA